jgi:hypothetical protein
MPFPYQVTKFDVEVTLAQDRKDNIKAFGVLLIYFQMSENEYPLIKVKGFTIKDKVFEDKHKIDVSFPGYSSRKGKYYTTFILDNKALYHDVVAMFLEKYSSLMGITYQPVSIPEEYVNPEDIPF